MLSLYPAIFFKEKNNYSVVFPDLNYLSTDGDTFEEAMRMTIDCLAGYLYSLELDGETFPIPSNINEIKSEAFAKELGFEYEEAIVNMVTVDVEEYAKLHFTKSVKKTLTIPEWLNDKAEKAGINFSKTLQEALISKL